MKKLLPILIGLSLTGFSAMSQAENLLQVYQQARLGNPDLRKSAADRDAAFEKINEARSPLLPQLGLGADYTYTNGFAITMASIRMPPAPLYSLHKPCSTCPNGVN